MSRNADATYKILERERSEFLDRARECAKLTLPFLLPEDGHDSSDRFYTPYQSFGSRAVNNLASKLLLALFPTSSPFFRYTADEAALQEAEEDNPKLRDELESSLKQREKVAMYELDNTPFRSPFFLALKMLVVTGNALLYLAEDGNIRVFRLDNYVVRRDPSGNVMEIIVQEKLSPLMIDEATRAEVGIENIDPKQVAEGKEDKVTLYTRVLRTSKNWEVHQEINNVVVESSKGSYPLDANPWLPLRFSRIDGEHYGRGLVEEYFGDLVTIEGLRKNLVEGAAVMSKVVFLVRKNGQTRLKDVSTSKNGDVRYGSADDVTVIQADKRADFAIIRETYRDTETELAKAFLLNSSVQRDAERVTATEIRVLARELEDTLGGVYTVQSQEFQLPFIKIFTARLEKSNKLKTLPSGTVTPTIVTGLSALGRTDDLERLLQFVEIIAQVPGAMERISPDTMIERTANSLFIDKDGLIIPQEEFEAKQNQQQMMQTMQGAAPGMLQEATKGMMNNVQKEQE